MTLIGGHAKTSANFLHPGFDLGFIHDVPKIIWKYQIQIVLPLCLIQSVRIRMHRKHLKLGRSDSGQAV